MTVSLPTLVSAFEAASDRLRMAMSAGDPEAMFVPLGEALSWAVPLSEQLKREHFYPETGKEKPRYQSVPWSAHVRRMKGLRFARNMTIHNWQKALFLSNEPLPAKRAESFFPLPVIPLAENEPGPDVWCWRPDLKEPDESRNRLLSAAYQEQLAGQDAWVALDSCHGLIQFARQRAAAI